MVVGEIAEPVDVLVVGGGPGGYTAAKRVAELGRSVTLVEQGGSARLGGSCLHVGCIPSKALIELATMYTQTSASAPRGLVCRDVKVDLAQFQEWKNGVVTRHAHGVATMLAHAGVQVLHGSARFSGANRASVSTPDGNVRFLEFNDLILATGSRPMELAHLPVDGVRVLDSTGALALDAVPVTVAVVGAGYVGLELGTALAKLGSKVTMVEALDRILPSVERAIAHPVLRRLGDLGVRVCLGSKALGIDGDDLVFEDADGEHRAEAERIIIAVGRRPNSDDLGLAALGVVPGPDGLIAVDATMRAVDRVFAIGDLVGGPALAHKAIHQARVAAEVLSGLASAFDPTAVPQVVFADPEVASVGLTERDARDAGLDVSVGTFHMAASGRAATMDERDGFAHIVFDRSADRVVGVHVVGPHASELISEGTLAIEMMASQADIAGTIHPHPTLSESLYEAAVASATVPLPATVGTST